MLWIFTSCQLATNKSLLTASSYLQLLCTRPAYLFSLHLLTASSTCATTHTATSVIDQGTHHFKLWLYICPRMHVLHFAKLCWLILTCADQLQCQQYGLKGCSSVRCSHLTCQVHLAYLLGCTAWLLHYYVLMSLLNCFPV